MRNDGAFQKLHSVVGEDRPSWTGGVARSAGVVAQEIVLEQPPRLRGFGRCRGIFLIAQTPLCPGGSFAQQKVRCPVSAVGAVYDRAFVPLDCENCAVIDRAYSKKVCVCSVVQSDGRDGFNFPLQFF